MTENINELIEQLKDKDRQLNKWFLSYNELKEKLEFLIDEYVAMRNCGGCHKYTKKDCENWLEKKYKELNK